MMRKTLQRVPLETGNRWAGYLLAGVIGLCVGWILSRALLAGCVWFA